MAQKHLFIAGECYGNIEKLSIPTAASATASQPDGGTATFVETTVSKPALPGAIREGFEAYANGEQITGSIPNYSGGDLSLDYTSTNSSITSPSVTISSGSYIASNITVTGPTYNALTTPGNAACPVTLAQETADIIQNAQYIKAGTLYQGLPAEDGGLAKFPSTQYSENDKNSIIELTKLAGSEDEIFVLKRITEQRAGNSETGAAEVGSVEDGRFYIPNINDVGSSQSPQYETLRTITNIYIPNLKPQNVLNSVVIAGMRGEYVAPVFAKTGTVLSIS